ncbi:hypothetical protein GCM10010342_77380 [Streptomyces anulatus]|nr:hypothetical protein GCM10010342_77380 [Streptomyces anulatus]
MGNYVMLKPPVVGKNVNAHKTRTPRKETDETTLPARRTRSETIRKTRCAGLAGVPKTRADLVPDVLWERVAPLLLARYRRRVRRKAPEVNTGSTRTPSRHVRCWPWWREVGCRTSLDTWCDGRDPR